MSKEKTLRIPVTVIISGERLEFYTRTGKYADNFGEPSTIGDIIENLNEALHDSPLFEYDIDVELADGYDDEQHATCNMDGNDVR